MYTDTDLDEALHQSGAPDKPPPMSKTSLHDMPPLPLGHGHKPEIFILDVDGVMTDGAMFYTADGKVMKRFGPDDHDALMVLNRKLPVRFVSGDTKGFSITTKRIRDDMKFPLDLVSTIHRKEWIEERHDLDKVIYMGDGIFDAAVLSAVGYGIAPADASPLARAAAHFVTEGSGGRRAVAEACLHILERFFERFDIDQVRTIPTEKAGT